MLPSEEIIAALREESVIGLKLYLAHLIFEKHDSVNSIYTGVMVATIFASRIVVALG